MAGRKKVLLKVIILGRQFETWPFFFVWINEKSLIICRWQRCRKNKFNGTICLT